MVTVKTETYFIVTAELMMKPNITATSSVTFVSDILRLIWIYFYLFKHSVTRIIQYSNTISSQVDEINGYFWWKIFFATNCMKTYDQKY
ncbi:MAG: hypothetical protein CMG71_06950 [Candidatus Marinimicrobia bacterium]|nr:hypothetical protein [Candidatus Neomarinimicrobiota bacterium]